MPARRKKTVVGRGVLSDIHKVVKGNKLISRGLKMIPHRLAQKASVLAAQAGYGKPKKAKKVKRGRGFIGKTLGGIAGGLMGGLLPF